MTSLLPDDPEVVAHREELRRARWAGMGALWTSLIGVGVMALLDVSVFYAVLPIFVLGMIPSLRMLLRPRPIRGHPGAAALKGARDGTTLRTVEGMSREEARLMLLDELDALDGPQDASRWHWWAVRFGPVAGALGTLGWVTAGVVAAVMGASAADLVPCVLGTALFGIPWWVIARERKKEGEAARILRERLDALDPGEGGPGLLGDPGPAP